MIKAQRGTVDVLPTDSYKWQYLENIAREVTAKHNILEVRTPTFEATELFARGDGEGSDIVSKEMYTFTDKGERSITLKPEGTAGVVRCGIEHSLFAGILPSKMYYFTPVFRYEKPQNGRLREHHQFGIELFGSKSPKMDAEAILVACEFFKNIGIKDVSVRLNSIGCQNCRPKYLQALKDYYGAKIDDMCDDCKVRYQKNVLRILDCKVDSCKKITEKAPSTLDYLCDDCKSHLNELLRILDENGIAYQIDNRIVRGIDYYTKTVFEFVTGSEGSASVIGGGGRYDNLVSSLEGNDIPAVGFGIGLERILLMLESQKVSIPNSNVLQCYIIKAGIDSNIDIKIAEMLRANQISADVDYMDRSFRANFNYANKVGAKYVAVVGQDELNQNAVSLKNMITGEQKLVQIDNLSKYLLEQK